MPVIELPSSVFKRTMNVEETREYLKETGQRWASRRPFISFKVPSRRCILDVEGTE